MLHSKNRGGCSARPTLSTQLPCCKEKAAKQALASAVAGDMQAACASAGRPVLGPTLCTRCAQHTVCSRLDLCPGLTDVPREDIGAADGHAEGVLAADNRANQKRFACMVLGANESDAWR